MPRIVKFFAAKQHDGVLNVFVDGPATTRIVDAYINGDIPAVREANSAAYEAFEEARMVEARTRDIWWKPTSWKLHDKLTLLLVVISLVMKVSANLAYTRVGVQWLTWFKDRLRRTRPGAAHVNKRPMSVGIGRGPFNLSVSCWKACRGNPTLEENPRRACIGAFRSFDTL
jgi:hypothetical protein